MREIKRKRNRKIGKERKGERKYRECKVDRGERVISP
jgi:hypothetical protein